MSHYFRLVHFMNKRAILFLLMVTLFVFIFGFIHYNSQPYVVNSFEDETVTVLSNKVWVINFSGELDESSITDESVQMINNHGEKLAVTIEVNEHNISISPPEKGYLPEDGPYKLKVDKSIRTLYGGNIRAGTEIAFNTIDHLPTIASKKELNEFFTKRIDAINKENKSSLRIGRSGMGAIEESTMAGDDSGGGMESSLSGSYSETNVQVTGVDEADIVKTDGAFIYQVIDQTLKITKVAPNDELRLVSEIRYQNFAPQQLYVDGDRLIVIGNEWKSLVGNNLKGGASILPMYDSTKMIIYNISDKEEVHEMRTIALEGYQVTSRKIDNYIYLITNHHPNFWALEEDKEIDLRPRYIDTVKGKEPQMLSPDYEDIYYIPESNENNFMNIIAVNIEEADKEISTVTYLGSGQEIFMNKDHLYVTFPTYHHENSVQTYIYKFKVNGSEIQYSSTGTVEGRLLNQFSMDEYNGHFRIATTKGDMWSEKSPSSNHLFILDDQLNVIGSVDNLARGERIYSVRFLGEKGYVVTFREVDPLFVFDLSAPTHPKVLGELKIPGFSNYLHPYDEHHLIGFGHETKLEKGEIGREPLVVQDGVKISLFDVSDPSNPKEKFVEVIGNRFTYSPLNYDHKALLFNKEKDIFAFPITEYNDGGSLRFQGALVYGIDVNKGFTLHKEISHGENNQVYENWEDNVYRILYINDVLYAVSPNKITAHKIDW